MILSTRKAGKTFAMVESIIARAIIDYPQTSWIAGRWSPEQLAELLESHDCVCLVEGEMVTGIAKRGSVFPFSIHVQTLPTQNI